MPGRPDSHLLLRAFADELARSGVRHACTSPGSRSSPVVLALAREPALRTWSHVDERCAGFFALGTAKACGAPAVVACTSGTAAANLLPAVIEAHEAGVPLVVLTADRPPELRDVGAGQAIDQLKLYGGAVRWFVELGVDEATPATLAWVRQLACRAVGAAAGGAGRPGPVHVNVPLREPLVLEEALGEEPGPGGRTDGRPWTGRRACGDDGGLAGVIAGLAERHARGVVVAGRLERDAGAGAAAAAFARAAGWPVLADPLSGARRGPAAVAAYDALLRDEGFAAGMRPDAVLRVGDLPTSKPLRTWLAGLDAEQVALAPEAVWGDPAAVVGQVLEAADPEATLQEACALAEGGDGEWLARWRAADEAAGRALDEALGDGLTEPAVARELARALPPEAALVVAASMPVRDVETFWPALGTPPRVLANRGANGIDGTTSTAFGVAAAHDGPVVLLTGDVTLVHDLGGLLAAPRLGLAAAIVVLDNGGGGIFDFLPVSSQGDVYEEHVATPTGLDVQQIAGLFGCGYAAPADVAELRAALAGALGAQRTTVVHVRTDRRANVALHRRCWDAVRDALSRPGPAGAPGA